MREIDEDFLDACRREGDPDGEAHVQLVFEALETGGSHAGDTDCCTSGGRSIWRKTRSRLVPHCLMMTKNLENLRSGSSTPASRAYSGLWPRTRR